MTKSIIEQIYLENQGFEEKIKPSEDYIKASDEAFKLYEQLRKILNEEQKHLFDNFADAEVGVRAEAQYMHFKEGLKVGLLLCIECLNI